MHHEMSLRPGPFAKIADGSKSYELRLLDEKRRLIAAGDTITFTCTADERSVTVLGGFAEKLCQLCGFVRGAATHRMRLYPG